VQTHVRETSARDAHGSPRRTDRGRAPAPALDLSAWIVFEDEALLAVNKPAGVLSQGGEGGEGVNLVDLARAYLGRAAGVGVLHRLDRNVSGLVLLAKDPRAAGRLSVAFAQGAVERVYEAVCLVRRAPAEARFRVEVPLRKDDARNQVEACDPARLQRMSEAVRAEFREALTDVRVSQALAPPLGSCVRCEARPITGRSHQLRVHLAFVGLPIVGDPKYGVAAEGVNRPLLHATHLRFVHPRTRETISLDAPVPWTAEDLAALAAPRVRPREAPRRPVRR
jgi:RluA family pseudouridine synthase